MKTALGPRGLRATVTIAFAVGALMLSLVLAVGTYVAARHYLLEQRERTALRQAFADASVARDGLLTSGAQVSDVLGNISPPQGSVLFLHRSGEWYSSSLDVRAADIPTSILDANEAGRPAIGWTDVTDPPAVVVGVPLPAVDAQFYELAVARELDRTLTTLRIALIVCAALTTVAGGLLGRVASRRLLTPLDDVTTAAARISAGDMDTRLARTDDPDLATLVGAFNNMVDALEERVERDARFAADVSHELRTPVTTLVTSLSVIEHSPDLSERSARAVRLMAAELERFRRSLEDLLTLGRLDSGLQETQLSRVAITPLVRQSIESSHRTPDLIVESQPPDDDPVVLVDRQQIARAIVNLLDNADTHGAGVVAVRITRHGDFVDVSIEDRGPGVDPVDRERIFERFARAGQRRSGTGTGLGLSIVAQTVHLHEGSVWCDANPGGGSRFIVRLPVAESPGGAVR